MVRHVLRQEYFISGVSKEESLLAPVFYHWIPHKISALRTEPWPKEVFGLHKKQPGWGKPNPSPSPMRIFYTHALISHPTHYFNFPNSFPVYMTSRQGVNFLRVSRSFNYVMYVSHKCIAQEIAEFQHLKLKIFQSSISLSSLKENILSFQSWRLALDEKCCQRHEVLMVRISHYKLMPIPPCLWATNSI